MPATVTLGTTTLTAFASKDDTRVRITKPSTVGLTPGMRLWVDRELMAVVGIEVDPWVIVRRGVDGTTTTDHTAGTLVTIGRADQFYSRDPVGRPPEAIPVSPYINVLNGTIWYAQGDASSTATRWWQAQSTSYDPGALGIQVATLSPTSST